MSKVTPQSLRDTLLSFGWESDRWGNMHKDSERRFNTVEPKVEVRHYRVKVQARSCRVEVRSSERMSDGSWMWVRVGGGYFSDCAHLPDGCLRVGGILFGKPASSAQGPRSAGVPG